MTPFPLGKIAVVGSGAVGSYYGGMLAHMGHDVHFLMRADLEATRARGLAIHTGGRTLRVPAQAHASTAEIGPCDLVIVALKATANAALDELIPPLLHERTGLVTLQNGLGNEEYLAARWGAERVMGALCFVCLNRTAPGEVTHIDHGSISIGELVGTAVPSRPPQTGDAHIRTAEDSGPYLSARVRALVEALVAAGIDAKAVEDLVEERWRKLVWNVPFNGLSIAARATVADVLADDALRAEARGLMSDVLDGARALGHHIPDEFADFQLHRSASMGAYRPSSMIDREAGRAVEVEAIWGEPLRQGRAAGAAMPRLALLYALLRRLTR